MRRGACAALMIACALRLGANIEAKLASPGGESDLGAPPLLGPGLAEAAGLARFALANNPDLDPAWAARVASVYIEESIVEGVNWDLAFAQMCLETGFLSFKGSVSSDMHNYCGLGSYAEGVRGASFPDETTGIRAHIQHLKAYASHEGLARPLVDPRFHYVKRGSARSLSELQGRWASDEKYAEKLASLLSRLYSSIL